MKSPFPKATYEKNATIYKLLANPKRLEILNLIKYQELPVENIIKVLNLSKSNVSQHLAVLRHARLVSMRREGLNVYYKIVNPMIVEPCQILHNLWKNKAL